MSPFALGVGCCCSATCDICTDTGGTGPCGLTQVAGTISHDADFVYALADNSIALSTQTSGSVAEVWAQVDFLAGDSGDPVQLILKSDSTRANCWMAQVIVGTGATLRILERVAGTNTQRATLNVTAPELETMTLHFCYGEGNVVATLFRVGNDSAQVSYATTTTETAKPYAGVSVGNITAEVDFSNFQYNYGYNGSGQSACPHCLAQPDDCVDVCGFTTPNVYTPDFDLVVDFSGGTFSRGECGVTWAAGDGTECDECDDFNGEWVIPASVGPLIGYKCPAGSTILCPTWLLNLGSGLGEWCNGQTGFKTDPDNIDCGGSGVMQLCISVTLTYNVTTAKWHWVVWVEFEDGGSSTGSSTEYKQNPTDPSIYTLCDEGPWTLEQTSHVEHPDGPACAGSLPTTITLRVQ